MPIRRLRGLRRSGARSRKEWTAFEVVNQAISPNNQTNNVLVSQATFEEFPRSTVVRIRGNITVSPNTQPAAATGYSVHMGIAMWGPSELWTAETQQENPWMWFQSIFAQTGGSGAADNNSNQFVSYFHIPFDVRSMRKSDESKLLVMAVGNSNNSGAAIKVSVQARILLLIGH